MLNKPCFNVKRWFGLKWNCMLIALCNPILLLFDVPVMVCILIFVLNKAENKKCTVIDLSTETNNLVRYWHWSVYQFFIFNKVLLHVHVKLIPVSCRLHENYRAKIVLHSEHCWCYSLNFNISILPWNFWNDAVASSLHISVMAHECSVEWILTPHFSPWVSLNHQRLGHFKTLLKTKMVVCRKSIVVLPLFFPRVEIISYMIVEQTKACDTPITTLYCSALPILIEDYMLLII